MSYVIKNCPAYDSSIADWNCLGSDCTECKGGHCILKQIVELCKQKVEFCKNCSKFADVNIDCVGCEEGGEALLGKDILSMLEIEKCEE